MGKTVIDPANKMYKKMLREQDEKFAEAMGNRRFDEPGMVVKLKPKRTSKRTFIWGAT